MAALPLVAALSALLGVPSATATPEQRAAYWLSISRSQLRAGQHHKATISLITAAELNPRPTIWLQLVPLLTRHHVPGTAIPYLESMPPTLRRQAIASLAGRREPQLRRARAHLARQPIRLPIDSRLRAACSSHSTRACHLTLKRLFWRVGEAWLQKIAVPRQLLSRFAGEDNRAGELRAALRLYELVAGQTPRDRLWAHAQFEAANLHYRLGNYRAALYRLSAILDERPAEAYREIWSARALLPEVVSALYDPDEALAVIVQLDRKFSLDLLRGVCFDYKARGRQRYAVTCFARVAVLHPDPLTALYAALDQLALLTRTPSLYLRAAVRWIDWFNTRDGHYNKAFRAQWRHAIGHRLRTQLRHQRTSAALLPELGKLQGSLQRAGLDSKTRHELWSRRLVLMLQVGLCTQALALLRTSPPGVLPVLNPPRLTIPATTCRRVAGRLRRRRSPNRR